MAKKDVTASDIKTLMLRNYRRFSNGEIDESKAFKENTILANILKAIEVSETQTRLEAIEAALHLSEDYYDNENDE